MTAVMPQVLWSTVYFPPGACGNYLENCFAWGQGSVGQGKPSPLDVSDTSQTGTMLFQTVSWEVHGVNPADRVRVWQHATWRWEFVMMNFPGAPLTYVCPFSVVEASADMMQTMMESPDVIRGFLTYKNGGITLPHGSTFLIRVVLANMHPPLSDWVKVKFILQGKTTSAYPMG